MYDFEHRYVNTQIYFFPLIFGSFQNFPGFYNFILFINLITSFICLSLEEADSLLLTFAFA